MNNSNLLRLLYGGVKPSWYMRGCGGCVKRKFCVDTLRVFNNLYADVVELVDTLALGASAARREGSSPFIRTKVK